MRSALFGCIVGFSLLASGPAFAQSDNAVLVLFNGGVETVEEFDLALDGEVRALRLGARRIIPAEIGPSRVADLKVLPDGSYLLADVDGRGAVVSTADGDEFRWVLDDQQRYFDVDSVTVASYFAPGEPSLVAVGDSSSSNVSIRATSQGNVVWFDGLRVTASSVLVPQVAIMPGNRLVAGVNWSELGIAGLEFRDTSDPLSEGTSIVSATWAEFSSDAIVVPELDQIRDLMGTPDGTVLVTTRYRILEMDDTGAILNTVDIGDYPQMSGEFASMRVLDSGNWAIATFQPGEWVTPNTNHRVHWYDPAGRVVVATTEPLSRAPLRVEPTNGHGGTGTFGFDGGLQDIQQGDPGDVLLTSLVVPPTVRVGGQLSVRATVTNNGDTAVGLARVAVRGVAGACVDRPADYDFAVARSVALQSQQAYTWGGEVGIDAQFATGAWCLFVETVDQQGMLRRFEETAELAVLEQGEGPGSTVDVIDLPFGPQPDMGGFSDAGTETDMEGGAPPPDKGCCAVIDATPPRSSIWLLIAAGLLIGWRRLSVEDPARP